MQDERASAAVTRTRFVLIGLLLLVGLQFSLLILHAQWPPKQEQVWLVGGLLIICAIPQVSRLIVRALDSIRHPSRSTRWLIALIISGLACVALYAEADSHVYPTIPR